MMRPSPTSRVCIWLGASAVLVGCAAPLVEHHIPVVAATTLLNLETAKRCDYIGVGYAAQPDAVVALKNFAGAQGGTLVLGFEHDLTDAAERDAATGVYAARVDQVSGKVVRCSGSVQGELITRATLVDTR